MTVWRRKEVELRFDSMYLISDRRKTIQNIERIFHFISCSQSADYEASELIPNIMTPKNGTTEQVELGKRYPII